MSKMFKTDEYDNITLYHIPGIKFGATTRPVQRKAENRLKYGRNIENIEIYTGYLHIDEATIWEESLNEAYGYKLGNKYSFIYRKHKGKKISDYQRKISSESTTKWMEEVNADPIKKEALYQKRSKASIRSAAEIKADPVRNANRSKNMAAGTPKGANSYQAIAVTQYNIEGNLMERFGCIQDAAKATGTNSVCISNVINGKGKTAGGYRWVKEVSNQ